MLANSATIQRGSKKRKQVEQRAETTVLPQISTTFSEQKQSDVKQQKKAS